MTQKLGLSGRLTQATIASPLTPLALLAAVVFGLIALINIPREEEPQISVPMVDISVQTSGVRAGDAVELVTKPLEEIIKGINGVEHVYSQTQDDQVVVTARFIVGTNADEAILRVHDKIRANYNSKPVGIPDPMVVGRGIDDVAIVVLTLSADAASEDRWREGDLYRVADTLREEIAKVDNVGLTYISGGNAPQIRIEPVLPQMIEFGITLQQVAEKVRTANAMFAAGVLREDGVSQSVLVGKTLQNPTEIGRIQVSTQDGRPVYIKDIARVVVESAANEQRVWTINKTGEGAWRGKVPAISLAVAKRAGANAVVVSEDILARLEVLRATVLPKGIHVDVTRNYGHSADEKANELLFHLGLATVSIVVLIALTIGLAEAKVTLVVIPVTILLTLFAANLMGYTINRVSLFALIFSIGILVDDAIVMVENIARHWAMRDGRTKVSAAIEAVAEVGNPTIVATMTVVAALLPMLFVSGLMGPYMAPIPINASAAMIFSFFVAVTIAPWLMVKFSANRPVAAHGHADRLARFYARMALPVIVSRRAAWRFLLVVGGLTLLSLMLFVTRSVTVKLLPFDNKSELSIVADLPEGTTLEETQRILLEAATAAQALPEVQSLQVYAGTAAPFNFNGLVRHYYMRQAPELGEVQINLSPKGERSRTSHDVALDLRTKLAAMPDIARLPLKIVEVPPGPPVLSTIVAEVYGADATARRAAVEKVKAVFAQVPYIVDIDDSLGVSKPRLHIEIDRERLEFFGVEEAQVYQAVAAVLGEEILGYSHRGGEIDPMPISLRLAKSDLTLTSALMSMPVMARSGALVELGDVVSVTPEPGSTTIFRHNGRSADMVTAELAGAYEAPIYAMIDAGALLDAADWGAGGKPDIRLHGAPLDESRTSLLWDGEWEITYVTFRDMGIAFGVALLGIYILVVGQFRSFTLPLVILTPVPLTFIGIMFGHWLFGAAFTATSMIGFIALAGIIVRNSILLVDFIRAGQRLGGGLRDVLLEAGMVRFRPILLTALAAMIGAATILTDPIFQGLAISLLFGLASSTALTILVIPAIYVVLRDDHKPLTRGESDHG